MLSAYTSMSKSIGAIVVKPDGTRVLGQGDAGPAGQGRRDE